MTRPVVKLTVTPLEDRVNPAKFTVSLLSELAGDDGDTIATHSGELSLTGAVTVDAADPTAAVKAAFSGTVHVTLGGTTTDYTFGPNANTPNDPFRIDVDGEQALISLEDMAGQAGCDYDYNDRSWAMMVRQTGAETVVSTGTYPLTGPGSNGPDPDEATVTVTVTVTQDKAGYEGLYHWNYHVTNTSFDDFPPPYDAGIGMFDLDLPEAGGVSNLSNSLGWDSSGLGFLGEPNRLYWGAGEWQPRILPGQSADFSFTTPVCGIEDTMGEVADPGYAHTIGGQMPGPALMIRSVTWWGTQAGWGSLLGANPNAGGGQRIFAEKLRYNSPLVNDKVEVRVELSQPVNVDKSVSMYLFDVDDPSAGATRPLDPLGDSTVDDETQPTDNRDTSPSLGAFSITVPQGKKAGAATLTVSHQPGDNFRVAATIDQAITLGTDVRIREGQKNNAGPLLYSDTGLADVYKYTQTFGQNSLTDISLKDARTVKSPLLTVWRSLHVERDHMGAPPAAEVFAADDVKPTGAIPDPSINLMITNYRAAYIETRDDLSNPNREIAFVHNLVDDDFAFNNYNYANTIRDNTSRPDFWVVQLFGAYEPDPLDDHDPDTEFAVAGIVPLNVPDGPCNVFTEVIRDEIAVPDPTWTAPCKPLDTVTQRVAMHESMHRFGFVHNTYIPGSDEGIMKTEIAFTGTDQQNKLTPAQIAMIRLQTHPR